MAARRIYPLISTQPTLGHELKHTVVMNGREVEVEPDIGDGELHEVADQSPELEMAGSRRRVRSATKAYAAARATPSAVRDDDEDD